MMTREYCLQLTNFFVLHPGFKKVLSCLCIFLPAAVMIIYPLLLLMLFIGCGSIPWTSIIAPALTLAGTVILRRHFPRSRPFEVLGLSPLIPHRPGGSFPSRHSASALAIALASFRLHPCIGILLTVAALFIGISRILTFLHFPRDVAAGYGLALVIGLPFLFCF